MAETQDLVCQWCKDVVAVATGENQWISTRQVVTFQEKFYCDEVRTCWKDLNALANYVSNNFQ